MLMAPTRPRETPTKWIRGWMVPYQQLSATMGTEPIVQWGGVGFSWCDLGREAGEYLPTLRRLCRMGYGGIGRQVLITPPVPTTRSSCDGLRPTWSS